MKTKILSFSFISVDHQFFSSIIERKFEYQVIKNGLLSLNILALNMIDITVRPKVSMPICIELTFTNALWLYATRVSASYDNGIGMVYWLFFWHFDAQIKTIFKLENFTLEFLCKWIINWANTINKYITVCWLNLRGSQERLRQDKKRHVCFENNFDWLNKMARNLDCEF